MNNEPVSQDFKRGYNAGFEAGELNGKHLTQAKTLREPSVKEITDLWLYVVNNKPVNDKRPIEWHFANAILRKAQEK